MHGVIPSHGHIHLSDFLHFNRNKIQSQISVGTGMFGMFLLVVVSLVFDILTVLALAC